MRIIGWSESMTLQYIQMCAPGSIMRWGISHIYPEEDTDAPPSLYVTVANRRLGSLASIMGITPGQLVDETRCEFP